MSTATAFLHRSVLIGGVLVATALGADAATVSRCTVLEGDTFVPALMIEINGHQELVRIGQRGLSRSIAFDADRAVAWAKAQINGNATWVVGSACGDGFDLAADDEQDDADDGCGGF